MLFVKSHWISLLSGFAALVAIAGVVYGMTRSGVVEEMEQHTRLAHTIKQLRAHPQNQSTIDAEEQRSRNFQAEFSRTLQVAETINKREPVLAGVFPAAVLPQKPYRFVEKYKEQLYELPRRLEAGDLPSAQEIEDEAEAIEEERRRAEEEAQDGGAAAPEIGQARPDRPVPPVPPRPPNPFAQRGSRVAPPGSGIGQSTTPGAGRPSAGALADAGQRAAAKKARSIRMYASLDPQRSSFHISPIVEGRDKPSPEDMWYAQVSLWVQQDIVDAIRKINDQAAQQLAARNEDAHVGNMPVKRVEGIQVRGYVLDTGEIVPFPGLRLAAGGSSGARGGGSQETFTGRKGDEQFDVIRFLVTVIIDLRDLQQLIDGIARENFYQPVGAEYEIVPPEYESGYYYGGEPVYRARLDFEGYMARKSYKGIMPKAVLDVLGIAESDGK